MALLTTKLIQYKNSVGNYSCLNFKRVWLNCETKLIYQSAQPLSTSIDIYKKSNFSPWQKPRSIYLENEHFQIKHTYSILAKSSPSIKKESLIKSNYNNEIIPSYSISNHQMQQERALSNTQEKPNAGSSKLRRFGGALIFGIVAGGGKFNIN